MKNSDREVLEKVVFWAINKGFTIKQSTTLDPYFKGNMNGEVVYLKFGLDDSNQLFSLLHMLGHSIQWAVSDTLKELGKTLHLNPSDKLIEILQLYEWEANCYALTILKEVNVEDRQEWMYNLYREDMIQLTHFYKTGNKIKIKTTKNTPKYIKPLISKTIPKFTPTKIDGNRDGLIIDFD